MSEQKIIKVLLEDGSTRDCQLEIFPTPTSKLVLHDLGSETQEFEGTDLFEALLQLRANLEQRGIRVLCNGARVDIYPSGMSRSMSAGRKAYLVRMGMRAELNDLVDIFDYADASLMGTVAQQADFRKKWLASLAYIEEGTVSPRPGEIEEARRHPGGWVYRVVGHFEPNREVPTEAIIGAWKVDLQGVISGPFMKNPNYDPLKWPL